MSVGCPLDARWMPVGLSVHVRSSTRPAIPYACTAVPPSLHNAHTNTPPRNYYREGGKMIMRCGTAQYSTPPLSNPNKNYTTL
jgi:hypothetical protein